MANDMTHANYTHGFSGGVTIRGMPVLNSYGGNVYWADSAGAASGAGTFQRPFLTIDAAVGNCTANNGDIIMVKPGHAETVSAAAGLDLDVAGITIVFLGNDTDRGTITFDTDAGADMDVDAANITVIGARFVAGVDALTGPIDVNSAGFKLIGSTFEDAPGFAAVDWVVADANADDMTIDGVLYRESTTGTQNQSLIQVAGATRPIIRDVRATGDFATGIIENGTAWIDATLENLVLDNSNASPTVAVLLQATSSGWMRNSSLRVASGSTGYTANNDMQFDNVNVTGTDAAAAADPTIGNLADSAATGAVTTTDTMMAYVKQLVTELQVVDEFHDVPAADNTLNAQINEVIGNKTDAAAAGAVTTTDTLVGYVKQLVTELQVVDEFHDVPAADATANAQINEVVGNKTDASVYVPGTTKSLAAYAKGAANLQENVATTTAAVIASGTATIFTIAGGPIEVLELLSVCVTANDATATTLKYTADPTDGAATDLTIASASLANAAAGTTALCTGTFASAPTVSANGTVAAGTTKFIVPAGVIQTITAVGATTGTWTHHLRYKPLAKGVTVS